MRAEERVGGGQLGAGHGTILADVGPRELWGESRTAGGTPWASASPTIKKNNMRKLRPVGGIKEGCGLLASSFIVGLGIPNHWLLASFPKPLR